MTHGSLFSGLGGFDLAAEWMGWENLFHCEIEPFPRHVLNYYWPKAVSYKNIDHADFTIWRGRINILTGGFPCQPYSSAGKRLGTDDARHKWPQMLRAIREIQPDWILPENVSGLINWNDGLVFEQMQTEMAAEGYEIIPFILPAASIGAPHRRDRIWFIAHAISPGAKRQSGKSGFDGQDLQTEIREEGQQFNQCNGQSGIITNPRGVYSPIPIQQRGQRPSNNLNPAGDGSEEFTSNPDRTGSNQGNCRAESELNNANDEAGRTSSNAQTEGLEGARITRRGRPGSADENEFHSAAHSEGSRMEGDGTDREQQPRTQSEAGLSGSDYSGNNWSEFPTESPLCGGNDGLPSELDGITILTRKGRNAGRSRLLTPKQTFGRWRKESIKGFGNAIVPQVAFQIFKAIELYDRHTTI